MSIHHALRQDQGRLDNAVDLRERAKRCREAAERVSHQHTRLAEMLRETSHAYDEQAARLEGEAITARIIQ